MYVCIRVKFTCGMTETLIHYKKHIRVVDELGENEISPRIDFLLQINELLLVLGLRSVWGGNPNFRIPKSGKWSRVRVPL